MLLTAGVAGGGYGALYEFCTHCCIHVIVRFDLAAYACTSHNSKYAYCPTHSAAPIYHDLNSLSFDSIRLSSPCPLYTNVLLYFCFARLICDAFALRFPHVSLHATRSSHCFSPVQVVAVAAATVATAAKVAAAATAASRAGKHHILSPHISALLYLAVPQRARIPQSRLHMGSAVQVVIGMTICMQMTGSRSSVSIAFSAVQDLFTSTLVAIVRADVL